MWEEQMLSKVVQQLHTHHTNLNYKKILPFVSRCRHSIDQCINVKLHLIKFNSALTEPKTMPNKDIPHSFGFITKPNLVYAARLAAARRLSYSCIDIVNQLARWQPWS